jgi:hypothetical protein
MTIPFLWIGFSVAVGMFASIRRNRSGFGWGVLAILISPLLAGIFLAILPVKPEQIVVPNPEYAPPLQRQEPLGIGTVIALVIGGSLLFLGLCFAVGNW